MTSVFCYLKYGKYVFGICNYTGMEDCYLGSGNYGVGMDITIFGYIDCYN